VRLLAILSVAAVVGGFALALTGASTIPGILLIVIGLLLGMLLGGIALAVGLRNQIREWASLLSGGGPESIRVVGFEPPQGWLFNRDATIKLEVRGKDGTTKQVERGIPIPPIQAFLWRVAGRVPTPLGNLAEARELDLALYRKS
jgi:hypothetical protein